MSRPGPAVLLSLALLSLALAACAAAPATNPQLRELPVGRWVKIHQQAPGDAVTFVRQKHGGSAFDSRRGRLVLFGSDTHAGGDWTNSPLIFDLAALQWQRPYPDDDPASYRVSPAGLPIAGPEGAGLEGVHPWAMHSFGAVTYDAAADRIVVASYPRHMAPGRFSDSLASIWPQVRRHPTWLFDPDSGDWTALAGEAVHFFPFAIAYDSSRGLVLGSRQDGIYELSLTTESWRKAAGPGLLGWASNAVYDRQQHALIVFGSHRSGNELAAYWPADGRHRVMPTPGPRPPGGRYVPLAYHPGLGRTVALIDGQAEDGAARAETWLYDLGRDRWQRAATADLPFDLGMNYNLEYDSLHRLLLLVAAPPGEAVAVWALKL